MIKIIATGSSGNCYLLITEKETLILELGINFKNIKKELDFNLSNVTGAIITHSHGDHTKGVKEALNSGIDVYMPQGTKEELGIESHRIHTAEHNKSFNIGEFKIVPFLGVHTHSNGEKCPILNYLIYHKDLGKILFITDSYYVKNRFSNVDHILIECNYSEDVLPDLPAWRARTIKSHMSLETLKEMLSTMDLSQTKDITLIHISSENGDPERFKKEIEELTKIKTYIGEAGLIIE